MEEGAETEACVGYVDWKGKPALRGKHGGMLAACFVLVVEIMENMAYLANASNLVTYLAGFMRFSLSRSATTVTNFMGTAFLLALLGGFLSDAFFTAYHIYLISALLEFLLQVNNALLLAAIFTTMFLLINSLVCKLPNSGA